MLCNLINLIEASYFDLLLIFQSYFCFLIKVFYLKEKLNMVQNGTKCVPINNTFKNF